MLLSKHRNMTMKILCTFLHRPSSRVLSQSIGALLVRSFSTKESLTVHQGYVTMNFPMDVSTFHTHKRCYVTDAEKFYTDLRVLNSAFEEARTAIEEARESVGTTYYAEDYEDAEKVTKVAVEKFQQLLKDTTDDTKRDQLNREHEQRMKQLSEEFKTLKAP